MRLLTYETVRAATELVKSTIQSVEGDLLVLRDREKKNRDQI